MKARRLPFLTSPRGSSPGRPPLSLRTGGGAGGGEGGHGAGGRTLGEDVPLHDPDRRVATTGAVGPQIHETPLEAGRPGVQDGPALLKELFRVNGLQLFRVGRHQILRVLGGGAAVEGLGESAVEPARAVAHGTRCGEGKHSHLPGSSSSSRSAQPEGKALNCPQKPGAQFRATSPRSLLQGGLKEFPGSSFLLGAGT